MQDSSSPSGAEAAGAPLPPAPLRTRSSLHVEWLIVAAAALSGWLLFSLRGHLPRANDVVEAPITLITSDREDLGCAADRAFGRYRCEYQAADRRWPAPPTAAEQLAAYYTEDRRMFLIPGLFEQPALAARYAQEPPNHISRDSLHRFTARCKLRLLEKTEEFQVRWVRGKDWSPGSAAWVAEPIECKIQDK